MIVKRFFNNFKIKNKKNESVEIENLKNYISISNSQFEAAMQEELHSKLIDIDNDINNGKYKGVVIYPLAINWHPVQRPHHILRILGDMGYICFFCENDNITEFRIEEKFNNVYLVNKQELLLPLVKKYKTLVLVTYFLQYLYAQHIPNKIIWMDVLDRLEFMSLYNKYSAKIWDEAITNSEIVSYSATNLAQFVSKRKDAILIENAVNIGDFKSENLIMPDDLKKVLDPKKSTIGYYGAVEEWMDFDLIAKLDNYYNVIIIGRVNEQLDIQKYNFHTIHFLGQKEYKDLKNYAHYFDVAIIPFKVNNLTNSVSPVKFFEYMALNKPVITSSIKEMRKYKCDVVRIVNKKNIIDNIEILLKIDKSKVLEETSKIAENNTWEKRVEKIVELI